MSDIIKRVTADYIQNKAKIDGQSDDAFLSPINLKLSSMTKIELPELRWVNMEVTPQLTKVANTGQTVIVGGTWKKNRPKIVGGPLQATYSFSQLHYHWGSDNTYGSEHSYNDKKAPLEMHAVFMKESCKTQEDALAERDGTVVISFAYRLDQEVNPGIKLVTEEIPHITNPNQIIELEKPVKLSTFVRPFKNDYFVYWGSVRTNACKHVLLWILCRQPYAVNESQLDTFRSLFTSGHQPIINNSRQPYYKGLEVFHVNPSQYSEDVLYKNTSNNGLEQYFSLQKIRDKQLQQLRPKSPSPYRSIERPVSARSNSQSISPKERSRCSTINNFESNESMAPSKQTRKPLFDSDNKKPKTELTETINSFDYNINGKESRKPQSHYTKYFSAQGKIEKDKTDLILGKPNQNEITVMQLETNSINTPSQTNSEQKENDSDFLSNIFKEKNSPKNITSQPLEKRTKARNDIFSNPPESETLDTNTILKLDEKENKADPYLNKEFGLLNNETDDLLGEGDDMIKNKCFNLSTTIDNTLQVFKQIEQNCDKINEPLDKDVKEIGVNTMSIDELLHSLTENKRILKKKCKIQEPQETSMGSGTGDDSASGEESASMDTSINQNSKNIVERSCVRRSTPDSLQKKSRYSQNVSPARSKKDVETSQNMKNDTKGKSIYSKYNCPTKNVPSRPSSKDSKDIRAPSATNTRTPKKNSNFIYTSLNSSKELNCFNSKENKNSDLLYGKKLNKPMTEQSKQPSSNLSQSIYRSKSNLTSSNVTRPNCFVNRPMTQSVISTEKTTQKETSYAKKNLMASNVKVTKNANKSNIKTTETEKNTKPSKVNTNNRQILDTTNRTTVIRSRIPSQVQKGSHKLNEYKDNTRESSNTETKLHTQELSTFKISNIFPHDENAQLDGPNNRITRQPNHLEPFTLKYNKSDTDNSKGNTSSSNNKEIYIKKMPLKLQKHYLNSSWKQ